MATSTPVLTPEQERQLNEVPQPVGVWDSPKLQLLADNGMEKAALRLDQCGNWHRKKICEKGHLNDTTYFCEDRGCIACAWVLYTEDMNRYRKLLERTESGVYEVYMPWVLLSGFLQHMAKYNARGKPIPILASISGLGNWQFGDDATKYFTISLDVLRTYKHLTARVLVFCGWIPHVITNHPFIKATYRNKKVALRALHRVLKPELPADPQEYFSMWQVPKWLRFEGMSQEDREEVFRKEDGQDSLTENFDGSTPLQPTKKSETCWCGKRYVRQTKVMGQGTLLVDEIWEDLPLPSPPPG